MLLILLACPGGAAAFESDQITRRAQPLGDALAAANERADQLLALAVDRTNERTGCRQDAATTHRVLARQVFHVMGRRTWVPARGELPQMEFGAYGAWMESGPVDRRTFAVRDDLYSRVRPDERPILALFGPASTVRLGDLLVGTDKIDHFWVQGWLYWLRSHRGVDEARAVAWGTRTELQIWGQATTGVFSWGDLAANHSGYLFYADLLSDRSPVELGEDGCVALVRGFRWEQWADGRFDEVLNPSTYRPRLQDDLQGYLARNRDNICAELPLWMNEEVEETRREITEEPVDYASDAAPPREDPFGLEALCAGVQSPVEESGEAWTDGWRAPWRVARRDSPRPKGPGNRRRAQQ